MQLCALDTEGRLVRASIAERQKDYRCLECGQAVRLRKGTHRKPHYFHSQPNQSCYQSGKSLVHLGVQNAIVDLLPPGEAEMEYRFDTIGRIADVAWISQKIVFEVQCAAITAEEVLARNRSYTSVGYEVVWILHTNRYNKVRVTSAEDVLQVLAHYYTDIDAMGEGRFFDQYAIVEHAKRQWRFPAVSIDVAQPYVCDEEKKLLDSTFPKRFRERYSEWSRGFSGDYLDKKDVYSFEMEKCLQRLLREEKKDDIEEKTLLVHAQEFFYRWIAYPYQVVLRHLLEKASR